MGFALKKAFTRTIHLILPVLRAQSPELFILADEKYFMNSNGIYAVEKMVCIIMALAKTIVFLSYPSYSFADCMPIY